MGTQPVTRAMPAADTKAKREGRRPSHVGSVGLALEPREIVLLGGSGDVGTRLARLLLENTSVAVTTVSRRSKGVVDQSGGRLRHVSLDLSGGESLDISAGTLVVNLTEATPPSLASQVVDSSGWFLETSATSGYLSAIMDALKGAEGGGTAILCVGAAPGLTNLLAAEMRAKAPETLRIDIGVEMGMGRHYGLAATEWFMRSAGRTYSVVIDRILRKVTPGQLKRRFAFSEGGSLHHCIGYGFVEQTVIGEGSGGHLKTVRSFVALDPAWMTRGFSLLLSLGFGPAIGRNAPTLTRWLLRAPVYGRTRSRFIVEGFDDAGQLTGQIRLETGDQAEATAAMILVTVQSALKHRDPIRPGATTIADHLRLDAALGVLRRVLPETRVTASFGRSMANRAGGGQ